MFVYVYDYDYVYVNIGDMRILLVSNGHGEDRLAAALGKALLTEAENLGIACELKAASLAGDGWPYQHHLPEVSLIELPVKRFPSEGFLRSPGDWFKDLRAGLAGHVRRQYRALKKLSGFDVVVAVGDFFGLAMSHAVPCQARVFVPTAKSDRFQPHLNIELFFIERWVQLIFPRDQETAGSLCHTGIRVEYVGNLMMDCLDHPRRLPSIRGVKHVIGILPGSHTEAYDNLKLVKQTIDYLLSWQVPLQFVMAVPHSLDIHRVKALMSKLPVICAQGSFRSVVDASEVVIGFSGTGNEQAVGLGKPVVTMPGHGPQTTLTRLWEQSQLLLGGAHVMEDGPCQAAEKIKSLLLHPEELAQHRDLGVRAMGAPGAALKMAKIILQIL